MPDGDFDALVEAVKKNPSTDLSVLNTSTLKRLAQSLAALLAISPTGSGRT
jgi:hypothetical protein